MGPETVAGTGRMELAPGPYHNGAETLLHGEFGIYPSKGTRYALSLTCTELHIQRLVPKPETDQRTVVALADVVGCHTLRSRVTTDCAAYFTVYAYPLKKRKVAMGSGRARQRTARTFQVDGADNYNKNQAMAEKWAVAIKCLVLGVPVSSETDISLSLLPRPRRLLLLLNPFGGRGNALQWCQSHILPMISEADISFNLIQTERANHARELVKGISLPEWDGIVTLSGDGLLYEVINGLMERPDWEQAITMPVGILPCGSGNALAGAINFNAGLEQAMGLELLQNCTVLLCHAAVAPLDLVSVTMASGTRCFSFLSVAWGFVSDVDIESEKYRRVGSARFTLGTMVRLASLHTYRGRLSYLPAPDGPAHRPISRSITVAANGRLPLTRLPLHRAVSDMGLCEERQAFRHRGPEPPDDPSPSPGSPPPISASALHPQSFIFEPAPEEPIGAPEGGGMDTGMGGPPDDLLVPLGQPVPPSWVTVEDDFVLVLAIYQTHLGADLLTAPFACLSDGLIHLCFVKAGVSRAALVRIFLAMEKGTHFEQACPHLSHVPVRAFRLEPLTRKGILTVDGERVEYGPLQAQVHCGLARLITGVARLGGSSC
ncbi:sphingosine kinase 2 [Alligator sinensis]|uniref:sphingosine kinase n=1 Tax=Alligator sinensis TaxID=38654 RepID=A0A3Q0GUV8_ALLSI|nr:sphingosine kinase 2 [Alligator sinensis]